MRCVVLTCTNVQNKKMNVYLPSRFDNAALVSGLRIRINQAKVKATFMLTPWTMMMLGFGGVEIAFDFGISRPLLALEGHGNHSNLKINK